MIVLKHSQPPFGAYRRQGTLKAAFHGKQTGATFLVFENADDSVAFPDQLNSSVKSGAFPIRRHKRQVNIRERQLV
jgi:hypothetical protein